MLSSNQVADFYLVQVRLPDGSVWQVDDMDYDAFADAVSAANRLSAWLLYRHRYLLPNAALRLRKELRRAGVRSSAVKVEVAYPADGAENGYAVACLAMAVERDDDGALPDTVIEEIVPVMAE